MNNGGMTRRFIKEAVSQNIDRFIPLFSATGSCTLNSDEIETLSSVLFGCKAMRSMEGKAPHSRHQILAHVAKNLHLLDESLLLLGLRSGFPEGDIDMKALHSHSEIKPSEIKEVISFVEDVYGDGSQSLDHRTLLSALKIALAEKFALETASDP